MSKKRTSPESSTDKLTYENDSDGQAQAGDDEDNTKRAKLVSLSDTTLEDLPIELFECILVKVVVMEVWNLKLPKSVWKEKADGVLSRLGAVCLPWSNILTSDLFMNELHRALDGTGERTTRLEIISTHRISVHARQLASLNNEIYIAWGFGYLSIYDCNNMDKAKLQVTLKAGPAAMTACNVSNCLYILSYKDFKSIQIHSVTKVSNLKFDIEPFVNDALIASCVPAVTTDAVGRLIVQEVKFGMPVLWIFGIDGLVLRKVSVVLNIPKRARHFLMSKANGNIAVVSIIDDYKTKLSEVTIDGSVVRQIDSRLTSLVCCRTDEFGRMLLSDDQGNHEFLDCDFSETPFESPQAQRQITAPRLLYVDRSRGEFLSIAGDRLTVSRFTQE